MVTRMNAIGLDDFKESFIIDPETDIGSVTLAVREPERLKEFYSNIVGFSVLEQNPEMVYLGLDNQPVIILQKETSGHYSRSTPGLFHFAVRLPGKKELGKWWLHLRNSEYALDGAGDHLVSEALYLTDPEGNGIEMYYDRPRDTWQYVNREVRMDTLAVDLESLTAGVEDTAFSGLPAGTSPGHIHLRVNDVDAAVRFYRDILGFGLMASWPGAAFLSAGGYHHHIGLNMWHSRGQNPPQGNHPGLKKYSIRFSSHPARQQVIQRIMDFDYPHENSAEKFHVSDPSGNRIELVIR